MRESDLHSPHDSYEERKSDLEIEKSDSDLLSQSPTSESVLSEF